MNKLIPIALLALMLSACEVVHEHQELCKVFSVEKQVETKGNKNSITTEIYWLVMTDRGTFRAQPSGFWRCAEAISLQKDSTYLLTVNGFIKSDILGIYPIITKVDKAPVASLISLPPLRERDD